MTAGQPEGESDQGLPVSSRSHSPKLHNSRSAGRVAALHHLFELRRGVGQSLPIQSERPCPEWQQRTTKVS
jgi:hypothetical protein